MDVDAALAKIKEFQKRLPNLHEDASPWRGVRDEVQAFIKEMSPVGNQEPKLRDAVRYFLDSLTSNLHMAREDQAAYECFKWLQDTADPKTMFGHGDPRYPWDDTPKEREMREPYFYWLAARVAYCAGDYEVATAACERAWRGKLVLLDIFDIAVLAQSARKLWHTAAEMFERAHKFLMDDKSLERASALELMWNSLKTTPEGQANSLSKKKGRALKNRFVRKGKKWEVTYGGKTETVEDFRGMRYLAALLYSGGQAIHVLALTRMNDDGQVSWGGARSGDVEEEAGILSGIFGDSGEQQDQQGRQDLRRDIARLKQEHQKADLAGNLPKVQEIKAELDAVERELQGSMWNGQPRKVGDLSDAFRSAVRQAIRKAIAEIRERHKPLGDHLACVHTGKSCWYRPDPPLIWEVEF
jgi:hypothetical protein